MFESEKPFVELGLLIVGEAPGLQPMKATITIVIRAAHVIVTKVRRISLNTSDR